MKRRAGWTGVAATAVIVFLEMGTPIARAQAVSPSAIGVRLDAVAQSYASEQRFMGSVLVVDGDHVLLDRGYGMADLDWAVPDAPDVKFRIGSLTKQFTAALVLLLEQDGKLSLSDPISLRLPEAPAAWAKITIAQLLHHTSGIPDFTADPRFGVWSASPRTPKEIIALVADKPLDFPTGSKFAYSNTNYEVLGAIIERVSGRTYADVLKSRLLAPLGLKDTGLDADDLVLPHRASGYARNESAWTYARSESMSVPWAAGAMYSTTADLTRWAQALHGGKVLSAASLAQMTTPGLGGYGMGLVIGKHAGEPIIWHNGGIEGFHSYLAWLPQQRLTVVVLSNDEAAPVELIGGQLIDVAAGRPVVLPSERKAVAISSAELARFVGVYSLADQPTPTKFELQDGRLVFGQRRRPLAYLGVRDGHPIFWDASRDLEVEFIPDANGAMSAVTVRAGDESATGRRS
jgi:CubicO group peptidase (beta-lactamase class C family)